MKEGDGYGHIDMAMAPHCSTSATNLAAGGRNQYS